MANLMMKQMFLCSMFFVLAHTLSAQWQVLDGNTNKNLLDIHFYNANYGVAVGWSGTIILTEDGGETWAPRFAPNSARAITSVLVLGIDTILIAQNGDLSDKIHLSVNGGFGWQQVNTGGLLGLAGQRIASSKSFGDMDGNHYSDNGGVTWEESDIYVSDFVTLMKVVFENQDFGVLSGYLYGFKNLHPALYRSIDRAASWKPLNLDGFSTAIRGDIPTTVALAHPDTLYTFMNVHSWFYPTDSNRLVRMTDFYLEDEEWQFSATQVNSYLPGMVNDAHFFNGDSGIAILEEGDVIETNDGGQSWTSTYSGPSPLRKIFAYDNSLKYVVGNSGLIIRSGQPPSHVFSPKTLSLELTPNPAKDQILLQGIPESKGQLMIYNNLGQVIQSNQWQGNAIKVNQLSSGVYHVVLQTTHQRYSGKLIKMD